MAQRSGVPQLLFLVAAALLSPAVGEMRVRGMNPSVKVRYHPGRDFTCLDGSDTISFSMGECVCVCVCVCVVTRCVMAHVMCFVSSER